jgi:hypothetical protein
VAGEVERKIQQLPPSRSGCPLRTDTAPTGDTRQGPLTWPLATFAVVTRDDPLNVDSIRLREDAVIV